MRRSRKISPLPVRNGIHPQSVFLPQGTWLTVLDFLCARFPGVSAERWQQRMAQGDVVDIQGNAIQSDQAYVPEIRLHYYREVEQEIPIPFRESVLFEDEHLLVVDKPHFLPTQPSGPYLHETLITRLRQQFDNAQLEVLHRLDRGTAGLVLVSKQPSTRDAYHALFRDQRMQKIYHAIAPLDPALTFPLHHRSRIEVDTAFYRRCEKPGQPNAETRIELIETRGNWGRYDLQPKTGKTHQLRVHMAALGIPIRFDPLYPVERNYPADDFSKPLQLLARELLFKDPVCGTPRHFLSQQSLVMPACD